jgi:hypothetical protein
MPSKRYKNGFESRNGEERIPLKEALAALGVSRK